jgi:hypothetical protein
LFRSDHELCLKTEYGTNEGRIDAYIVSTGEFFWGAAPQTIASQREQLVTPIDTDTAQAALDSMGHEELVEALKQASLDLHEAAGRFSCISKIDAKAASELTRECARKADAALAKSLPEPARGAIVSKRELRELQRLGQEFDAMIAMDDRRGELAVLERAIDRMGWPEIHAFQDELRKGQGVSEDAGGFLIRAIKALFGIRPDPVETYRDAMRALITTDEARDQPLDRNP